MYLGLDALTYLDAAGIKRSEFAKRCQREAYKAWVLGLVCSAFSGVYSLWVLNGRMVSATAATTTGKKSVGGGSDVEDKVEEKKIARYVVLLTSLVLDIFVFRLILHCSFAIRKRGDELLTLHVTQRAVGRPGTACVGRMRLDNPKHCVGVCQSERGSSGTRGHGQQFDRAQCSMGKDGVIWLDGVNGATYIRERKSRKLETKE